MLVALNHMQVSMCYLRGKRQKTSGLAGFRKNIISLPQDLTELKHLQNFFVSLTPGDVVNIRSSHPSDSAGTLRRAKIVSIHPNAGFRVQTDESDTPPRPA